MTQAGYYNKDKTLLLFKHGRGLVFVYYGSISSYPHDINTYNPHILKVFTYFFFSSHTLAIKGAFYIVIYHITISYFKTFHFRFAIYQIYRMVYFTNKTYSYHILHFTH